MGLNTNLNILEIKKAAFCKKERSTLWVSWYYEATVDHVFVSCQVDQSLWSWIANYNNFVCDCLCVVNFWELDYCIALKNANLVEIIQGVVLWSLWLDKNRIVFRNDNILNIQTLCSKIISIAFFWTSQQKTHLT